MVYVPWVFPFDLISVPADPPVKPWVMQSDAAHYIVTLKGVADTCRRDSRGVGCRSRRAANAMSGPTLAQLSKDMEELQAQVRALQDLNNQIKGGTRVLLFLGSLIMGGSFLAYNLTAFKGWLFGRPAKRRHIQNRTSWSLL